MIPGTGAGDIQKMSLGVVDLLKVSVVSNSFDAILKWDNLVITGHNDNGAKLQLYFFSFSTIFFPLAVRRYFCLLLVGLPGIVISIIPAVGAGIR